MAKPVIIEFVAVDQLTGRVTNMTATIANLEQAFRKAGASIGKTRGVSREAEAGIIAIGKAVKSTIFQVTGFVFAFELLARQLRRVVDGFLFFINQAVEFEKNFTRVAKTVNGTNEQLASLSLQIRLLARQIPLALAELTKIGELGGQLGVPIEQMGRFIEIIGGLGVATTLSVEEASLGFARLINVMDDSFDRLEQLAGAVVDLGNNFAATEPEILNTSIRFAGAARAAGFVTEDVLALSTALAAAGLRADEAGGAISKILQQIQIAVQTGNDELELFAITASKTVDEFVKAFKVDPFLAFIDILQGIGDSGEEAGRVLEALTVTEIRQARTLTNLAGRLDLVFEARRRSIEQIKNQTALTEETERAFGTEAARLQKLATIYQEFNINVGQRFLDVFNSVIGIFEKLLTTSLQAKDIAEIMKQIENNTKLSKEELELYGEVAQRVFDEAKSAFGGLIDLSKLPTEFLTKDQAERLRALQDLINRINELKEATKEAAVELDDFAGAFESLGRAFAESKADQLEATKLYREQQKALFPLIQSLRQELIELEGVEGASEEFRLSQILLESDEKRLAETIESIPLAQLKDDFIELTRRIRDAAIEQQILNDEISRIPDFPDLPVTDVPPLGSIISKEQLDKATRDFDSFVNRFTKELGSIAPEAIKIAVDREFTILEQELKKVREIFPERAKIIDEILKNFDSLKQERLKNILSKTSDDFDEFAKQTARRMTDAFGDFFFDAIKGEFDSFTSFFGGLGEQIIKSFIDAVIAKPIAADLASIFTAEPQGGSQLGVGGSSAFVGTIDAVIKGFGNLAGAIFGESAKQQDKLVQQTQNQQKAATGNQVNVTNAQTTQLSKLGQVTQIFGQTQIQLVSQLTAFASALGSLIGGRSTFLTALQGLSLALSAVGAGINLGTQFDLFGGGGAVSSAEVVTNPAFAGASFGKFAKGSLIHGGNLSAEQLGYINQYKVPKFAKGARGFNGPLFGVFGEAGDEIVAKMLPPQAGDRNRIMSGFEQEEQDMNINVFIVDERRKLTPNDVVTIVDDDIVRNKSVAASIKRRFKLR